MELRLQIPLGLLFPITWVFIYRYMVMATASYQHEAWTVVVALLGIWVLPVAIYTVGVLLYRWLHQQIVVPKFGAALTSFETLLRRKFPLAYTNLRSEERGA